jgi:acylphosphatase
VQNKQDGTVYVVAQGSEEALNQYVEYLKKGSMLSRVEGVKVEWGDPKETFSSFTIVF